MNEIFHHLIRNYTRCFCEMIVSLYLQLLATWMQWRIFYTIYHLFLAYIFLRTQACHVQYIIFVYIFRKFVLLPFSSIATICFVCNVSSWDTCTLFTCCIHIYTYRCSRMLLHLSISLLITFDFWLASTFSYINQCILWKVMC